jgi:type VI secretion system protein
MAFFRKFDTKSRVKSVDPYLASIVENLDNILNTKKNYGSFLNDLGIRDLSEYSSKDDIASVVLEEVKKNIEQYEPRVELVDITAQENDSPFVLSFEIKCVVRKNAKSLHMVFDTLSNKFLVHDLQD